MSNPALADTLQQIADNKAHVLYNGPLADGIVAAVCSTSCAFSMKCFCRTLIIGGNKCTMYTSLV